MPTEPTKQVAFRFPVKLLKELDAYAERLKKEQPGLNITRADAVRLLLTKALASASSEERAAARPKPRKSGRRDAK